VSPVEVGGLAIIGAYLYLHLLEEVTMEILVLLGMLLLFIPMLIVLAIEAAEAFARGVVKLLGPERARRWSDTLTRGGR